MEIRADTSFSSGYEGKVSIRYGSHVVHFLNSGTVSLGKFLTACLTKTFDERGAPRWLSLERQTSSGDWVALLNKPSVLTGGTYSVLETEIDNVIGTVKFVGIVQKDQVILQGNMSGQLLRLVLMNDEQPKQVLATIVDTEGTELPVMYSALQGGQEVVIEWTMNIKNV